MKYRFKLAAETAEIWLYGEVGGIFGGVDAEEVNRDIMAAAGRPLTMRINSPGGDAFDGIAIHAVASKHGDLTAYIDGVAASSASLVAMAADRIVMAPAARIMIHEAHTVAIGDADMMDRAAALLRSTNEQITDIYSSRSGQSREAVLAMLAAETWFTPAEALTSGFADAVDEMAPSVAASIEVGRYQHTPAELLGSEAWDEAQAALKARAAGSRELRRRQIDLA